MRKKGKGKAVMTIEKKFPLKLDLQFFAETDDVDNIDNDDIDDSEGMDDLINAIKGLKESEENQDDNPEDEDDLDQDDEQDDTDPEDEDLDSDENDQDDSEDEDEEPQPAKKKQSKEENAKFAAQRRQQELEARVQAELEKRRQADPEYQLSKYLSETYGRPANEIMEEMREAALQQEAKQRNLPVELLRERQQDQTRISTLEQELQQMKFQTWQTKIQADSVTLKSQYPMLSDEDMDAAVSYMLNTVRNVDLPLEDAVYAVHGKKIIDSLAKQKVQDDLAKQSGRSKKTPLAPKNGKASKAPSLTADERAIAAAFNMSPDEYLKYKS